MDPFEYLDSRGHFNIDPGLERVERIMNKFKDPHRSIPAIHIGGTNGKGSTSAIVAAILGSFPVRIGTYTSPHLERLTERMKIDGEEVDKEELRSIMTEILAIKDAETFEGGLTYFELLTAASFLWMERKGVDVNISEVGMGGRWDATNILEPQAVAITSISMDHMEYLGDDPISIASEKCGIIKPSTPIVVGEVCSLLEERNRCLRTILDVCTHNGCPVVLVSNKSGVVGKKKLLSSYNIPDWRIISVMSRSDRNGTSAEFEVHGPEGEGQTERKFELLDAMMGGSYQIPLLGKHQAYNLGIGIALSLLVLPFAVAHSKLRGGDHSELSNLITGCVDSLVEEYSCGEMIDIVRSGLRNVELKGRMESFELNGKSMIVDGGHNVEAARMISNAVKECEPDKPIHLLFCMMGDKEPAEYLHEMDHRINSMVLAPLPFDRTMTPGALLKGLVRSNRKCREIHIRDNIQDAIDLWLSNIGEDDIGLAVGSFYLYNFIKEKIRSQKV